MDEKTITRKVKDFIAKYELFTKDDKILVAISGGKDSSVLLHLLNKFYPGQLTAFTFNPHVPKYSNINLKNSIKICKDLGIPLKILSLKEEYGTTLAKAKKALDKKQKRNYCTICGVLKRTVMNKFAREQKATVITTGHNRDDIAQSILMNMMRGKIELSARIGPVSGLVKDPRFIRKVKPLYLIPEEDIKKFSQFKQFDVHYDECPYSESAYRNYLKHLLIDFEKKNPNAIDNLVNVFLDKIYPDLQKRFATNKMPNFCEKCGEPCSKDTCATCLLIDEIRGK